MKSLAEPSHSLSTCRTDSVARRSCDRRLAGIGSLLEYACGFYDPQGLVDHREFDRAGMHAAADWRELVEAQKRNRRFPVPLVT